MGKSVSVEIHDAGIVGTGVWSAESFFWNGTATIASRRYFAARCVQSLQGFTSTTAGQASSHSLVAPYAVACGVQPSSACITRRT
jgi:hypothetical protein